MSALLQVDSVSKRFKQHQALCDVSLRLNPGEILALLGPNGAGKTTLINSILGRTRTDSGEILINGIKATEVLVKARRAAMLQVSNVPDTLTIAEHIELFRRAYPNPLPLEQAIDMAGLGDIAHRRGKELSGGQKQRLMFALAICGNAELLCLDEPSVAMDGNSRQRMWQAIAELRSAGKGILLTTHYLEEADHLADNIAILDRGRIIANDNKAAIKQRVSANIIQCHSALTLAQLQGLPGVTQVNQQQQAITLLSQSVNQTTAALLAADPHLSQLSIQGASLEAAMNAVLATQGA